MDKYISVGWTIGSKLWEKKSSRGILFAVGFQVVLGVTIIFMEYLTSYANDGNFLIADTISSFCQIFGGSFHGTPLFNTISTILFSWLVFLLFPVVIKFVKDFKINKKAKILEIYYGKNKIKYPLEIVRSIIFFGSLLSTAVQLLIFYYVIYPHQLPQWIWVSLIFILLLTVLMTVIFINDMQKVFRTIAIQSLFIDEIKYSVILNLIDEIIENGKTFVIGQNISLELREYISTDIIVMTPGVKQDSIDLDKEYMLEMSKEVKELYKLEKEVHQK